MSNKNYRVLDLFCGAGGFSEGFRKAGYEIVSGIDNDPFALETYSKNFPEAIAIKQDLSTESDQNSTFLRKLLRRKIDLIIGGPPCQGFSIAGKRLKDDPRNSLYRAYLRLLAYFKPTALVMENVPTILSIYDGIIARQIVDDFDKLGYKMSVFTLLASHYGVPQKRKRTFFVGIKGKNNLSIPRVTTINKPITTREALSDLPLLNGTAGGDVLKYSKPPQNQYQKKMREKSLHLYNHWAVEHKEQTIDIIRLVPDGGNYKDLPGHLQKTRKVNIAWTRMDSRKPCFTIDAGHNHHFHYKANRVPTVRECARIQSFPDRFRFYGNKTSQFKQVGNAVPPLLAQKIAMSVKEAINDI